MGKLFKSFSLLDYGVFIIGFLFLQDYYIATTIFTIPLGVFVENYVHQLASVNFIAFIVFIPLLVFVSVLYVAYFIYTMGKNQKKSNRSHTILFFIGTFVILSIFLFFFDYTIKPLFRRIAEDNFFAETLIYVAFFSYLVRSYKLKRNELLKKLLQNYYMNQKYHDLYNLKIFGSYLLRENRIEYIAINIWFLILLACVWIQTNFLTALLAGIILYYLVVFLSFFDENKNQEEKKAFDKKFYLVILIVIATIVKIENDREWKSNKLEKINTESAQMFGVLNKSFLVRNDSNITINDGFEFLDLDSNETLSRTIYKSNDLQKVYYLPISAEMKWYFIDRHQPNVNNSNITIYGVEEKTSSYDPKLKVHNLTFVSHFDVNVSE